MAKHEEREDLRKQIIDAAWELFYKQGYENTTVNDIVKKANTSKGGFYYYFKAKEELLKSLYAIFDREYEKFYETMDRSLDSIVQLEQLIQYVSYFIEGNVSAELLAALYQSQLTKKKQDCFLNPDRFYNRLVRKIIAEGQKKHEIREDMSVEELAHHVLLLERGIIMDWCVQNGSFSLGYFGSRNFDLYIEFMRPRD